MKKVLALLLALIMVVGLVACAGTDTKQGDTNTTNTETKQEEKKEDNTFKAASDEANTKAEAVVNEEAKTEEEELARYGGHLRARSASKCTSLDPLKATGIWRYQWTTCVYEPAITRDADGNMAPGVCNYELSADNLTLKLWVRDGVKFSNGDLVDIEDVKASLERACNLYSSIKTNVAPYATFTVDGDCLTIQFSEYHEKELYYLASYQTWCAIQPKEICEKYAEDYNTENVADAIGTGPYKVDEFEVDVQITVVRNDNYVPNEPGRTGFAGVKKAYLDSITFITNQDDGSASLALLAGDYDCVECIPSEYMGIAQAQNIKENIFPSDTGCVMRFNGIGPNVCAKYPDLRKAIMAAVDYEEFLKVVTDNQQVMGGYPVTNSLYATEAFEKADYYGKTNLEVAAKYLEAARAAGYNDEPVQVGYTSRRTDINTLLEGYLNAAGIPCEVWYMEDSAYTDFISVVNSKENNWDLYFYWPTWTSTPTLLASALTSDYYPSEERDAIVEEMNKYPVDSKEYLELWQQYADLWVDDCNIAYMSYINWYWYAPQTLVFNDEGLVRYFFNTYWEDPENHTR